jgi:hypothetical protein
MWVNSFAKKDKWPNSSVCYFCKLQVK